MKNITLAIIFIAVSSVHAQIDERATLDQIRQEVVSVYKSGDYEKAAKLAQQALELCTRIYGIDHRETAAAYLNMGVILKERKKYKESAQQIQTAIEIYKKIPELKGNALMNAYETMALTQFLGGKADEAEASYLNSIATVEKQSGKDSKESFSATLSLAGLYALSKKYEKADEFYLKSFGLAYKHFGFDAKEVEQVEDSRACTVAKYVSSKAQTAFYEARKQLTPTGEVSDVILNGKALLLPKPNYPAEARMQRLGGVVVVRVRIDEQGDVYETKAVCGDSLLAKISEESAKRAKFSPTTRGGQAIKIRGMVIYTFIP
jgi:TonB family protein